MVGVGPDPEPEALSVVSLDAPEARLLEDRMTAELAARYDGRRPSFLPAVHFDPPGGCFVVARGADGAAVACGGFRSLRDGVAEIKRMFVERTARGRGLGRRVLLFLEERARRAGYAEIWLETGTNQPEAMALYESAGYLRIPPYGEFRRDPRSR